MSLPDTSFLKDIHAYRDRRRATQKKNQKKLFWGHLLQGLAGKLDSARAEAKEDFKDEQAKADRNMPFIIAAENEKKGMETMIADLKNLNVPDNSIMYYMKDGPESLKAVHKSVTQTVQDMTAAGIVLEPEDLGEVLAEIMDIPAAFKQEGETTSSFLEKMYNGAKQVNKADPPKDPVGFIENMQLAVSNLTGWDAYDKRLSTEKYMGDWSVRDINRYAASGQTTVDPTGGLGGISSMNLQAFPRILPPNQVPVYANRFDAYMSRQDTDEARNKWVAKTFEGKDIAMAGEITQEGTPMHEEYMEELRREKADEWMKTTFGPQSKYIIQQLPTVAPYLAEPTDSDEQIFREQKKQKTYTLDNADPSEGVPEEEQWKEIFRQAKADGVPEGSLIRVISAYDVSYTWTDYSAT